MIVTISIPVRKVTMYIFVSMYRFRNTHEKNYKNDGVFRSRLCLQKLRNKMEYPGLGLEICLQKVRNMLNYLCLGLKICLRKIRKMLNYICPGLEICSR